MNKRVLVTGGAGFIGSHVCEKLIQRGDKVACIDSFDPYYDRWIKERNIAQLAHNPNFELFEVDIRNAGGVQLVFDDFIPNVVIHLAARAGVRPSLLDPKVYYDVNIAGSQNIMDQAHRLECSHIVMASSSSVYGGITATPFRETMEITRPLSPYAASKAANELIAHVMHQTTGLKITLLRFFTAYGPRQRPDMAIHKFTKLIDEGKPVPMFGDGSTRRDYTFIDDIVAGIRGAIDYSGSSFEVVNLGNNQTVALTEMIGAIEQALGVEAKIDRQPEQPGDVPQTWADVGKARELFGYQPATGFADGVRRFTAWLTSGAGTAR